MNKTEWRDDDPWLNFSLLGRPGQLETHNYFDEQRGKRTKETRQTMTIQFIKNVGLQTTKNWTE